MNARQSDCEKCRRDAQQIQPKDAQVTVDFLLGGSVFSGLSSGPKNTNKPNFNAYVR